MSYFEVFFFRFDNSKQFYTGQQHARVDLDLHVLTNVYRVRVYIHVHIYVESMY